MSRISTDSGFRDGQVLGVKRPPSMNRDGVMPALGDDQALRLIGVVSTAPGVLLNENHDPEAGKLFPIALCGRVPCKVVAENGPIQRGDLLTSSSRPGRAMKAQPLVVGGQTFYQPGTILGKAMGALVAAEGVIDILVTIS